MTLKVGALFAGYGGIELALASVLDTEPAWFNEFDKAPSAILAHHWPDVPNLGDVTKIDWAAVEPVDVIAGGSPCQDLSHAGKRAGMKAGTRSGLWASMCDAIDIIRPKLVIWENVRGAYSASATSAVEPCPICMGDGGRVTLRALGRVLGDLAELGYDARWYGLRAADVGAAHGRFRVFLFATPRDTQGLGVEGLRTSGVRVTPAHAGPGVPLRSGADAAGVPGQLTLLPTPTAMDSIGSRNATAYRSPDAGPHNSGTTLTDVAWQLEDYTDPRLLPTPRATRGGSGTETLYGLGAERSDANRPQGEVLLPTPSVADGMGGHLTRSGARSGELLLPGVAKDLAGRLLPTPRATDGTKGGPNQRGSSGDLMLPSAVAHLPEWHDSTPAGYVPPYLRPESEDEADCPECSCPWDDHDAGGFCSGLCGGNGCNGRQFLSPVAQKMLPTPTVGDSKSARNSTATRHVLPPTGLHAGDTLTDALVPKLLPTPNVADAVKGGFDHKGGNPTLRGATEDTAREQDWREYESAIRRQEAAFGRPAPLPTEPGAKGQPRLSPKFVEWLMGLPDGHVTDPAIGISRNEQLKALGNGVVPQQAAAALRAFLHDTTQERSA